MEWDYFFTPEAAKENNIEGIYYVRNDNCFYQLLDDNLEIYEVKCKLKGEAI